MVKPLFVDSFLEKEFVNSKNQEDTKIERVVFRPQSSQNLFPNEDSESAS
jgi:hypothetical protein